MRWRMKPRMGWHHAHGVTYKPGDVIDCEESELGGARAKFEPLDPVEGPRKFETTLVLVGKADGSFDVENGKTGERLNKEPLSEEAARELVGLPPKTGFVHTIGEEVPAIKAQKPTYVPSMRTTTKKG